MYLAYLINLRGEKKREKRRKEEKGKREEKRKKRRWPKSYRLSIVPLLLICQVSSCMVDPTVGL